MYMVGFCLFVCLTVMCLVYWTFCLFVFVGFMLFYVCVCLVFCGFFLRHFRLLTLMSESQNCSHSTSIAGALAQIQQIT